MTAPRRYPRVIDWFRRSTRRKLVFWTTCFWLLSMTALGLTMFLTGQNAILGNIRTRNIQTASVTARDVNSQISGILTGIRSFTHYLQTLDPSPAGQSAAMYAFELASPDRYRGIYYFDNRGQLMLYLDASQYAFPVTLSQSGTAATMDVPDEVTKLVVTQQASGTGVTLSEVSFMGIDRAPVITIATSVIFPSYSRVLVLEVELDELWQHILRDRVGESGFTYAVSEAGIIIAHPDPVSLGTAVAPELEAAAQGYEGFVKYHAPTGELYAAYSPVGGPTGWGIVVQQSVAEANAPLARTTFIIGGVWLALALVGTAGILWLARGFTRPIVELTSTTREIERTGRLVKTSLEERTDEVGQLSQSFDRMVERLDSMEGRLATVAAEERNRLARDLHDAVSQTLFSASLIAEVLPKVWARDPEAGKRRLEEVRQLTRGALAEMRTLLLELRPAALVEAELPHLLTQLGESIGGRTGAPVTVTVTGECDFSADVKIALYRIAQEALNNVAKHAAADHVTVDLGCEPDRLILTISDDGDGFNIKDTAADSLGLRIMRERSEEIGARLTIASEAGKGTKISVAWKKANGR